MDQAKRRTMGSLPHRMKSQALQEAGKLHQLCVQYTICEVHLMDT